MVLSLGLFATGTTTDSLKFEGSLDAYFRANLNGNNNAQKVGQLAPATSFANLPGFSLGMFNLIGTYERGKVGAVADLVFGPRGVDAVFASAAPLNVVNQLYVYYALDETTTLTLGNFNTFLGYEVISPVDNFNYSTSYLFSYGPFSHTGLKADFDFGKGFSGMVGVFNPTDATDFNPNFDFTYGAQLGYANDAGGVYLNVLTDPSSDFTQVDLTADYQVSELVHLGINASNAGELFAGVALYGQAAVNEKLSLGLRGEYFVDKTGGILGLERPEDENSSVLGWTLSANYVTDRLTIIPELRLDALGFDGFVLDGDEAAPEFGNSLSSFVLAVVYDF